jgi:hypothetical protein
MLVAILFNAIIESLDLREIILLGRQYTWVSRREVPTYEKLDHVLANVELMGIQISPSNGVCLGNKNHLHSSYPGSAMMASLIW